MIDKVRWGILSTANIAVKKVVPAMQRGDWSEVKAIASRDLSKAQEVAKRLGIPKAYGSYEELLADRQIEAIYNPLPNHLHVPWTARAAGAGKHLLCEKPIALNRDEANTLIEVRDRTGKRIQEAFMVRTHPQWLATRDLIRAGRIGQLRSIVGFFSYFNPDKANIRNKLEFGGGALMDIGCYPITLSRFIFETEPKRVLGLMERDPEMRIDRLTSAVLDFPGGQSTFTCGTQLVPYQRMIFFGQKGRIETVEFPPCDQYTIQGDLFSQAIRENKEQPIPLEDAIQNMGVIDAIFRSAASSRWEEIH